MSGSPANGIDTPQILHRYRPRLKNNLGLLQKSQSAAFDNFDSMTDHSMSLSTICHIAAEY